MTRSGVALLAAALAAGAGPVWAAKFPLRSEGRPSFRVEAVTLPVGPDSARVQMRWEIPHDQLTFRQEDGWYRAPYDVTVVFLRSGRQITGDVQERRVRCKTFREARSPRLARGHYSTVVQVGQFDVRVTVTDLNSGSTSAVEGRVSAVFGPSRIGLSNVQFLRYTGEGYTANPRREVPLGEAGHVARVVVHPEQSDGGSYRVHWRFSTSLGRSPASGDTTITVGKKPTPVDILVPEALEPGAQKLDVRLEGLDGKPEESRETTFFVRLTAEWFRTHRDRALEAVEEIASGDDLRALREADGADWPSAIDDFWRRNDPDPSTPTNELRNALQERMESAATLFHEPFRRPGWRTDRGRVFLQYGRPDRRTIRQGDFDVPASELWEYDSPRRVFFFVDERGTGEFWLQG